MTNFWKCVKKIVNVKDLEWKEENEGIWLIRVINMREIIAKLPAIFVWLIDGHSLGLYNTHFPHLYFVEIPFKIDNEAQINMQIIIF